MYPPPAASLTAETIRALDDQFFTSDPFAYIRSRILNLLNEDRPTLNGPHAQQFAKLLGSSQAHYAHSDERTVQLQIALDSFAVRHQVAESLLRILHAVLHHQPGLSHWVELTDTPTRTMTVIEENHAVLDAQEDGGSALLRHALLHSAAKRSDEGDGPESETTQNGKAGDQDLSERDTEAALALHVAWINYAIALFSQRSPDLDAAHNKFKHGLGLRPQDDVLSTFTTTPPKPDGGLPLSALTGDNAINLFDGITTEFLARSSRKHGLEVTQLAMLPAPTLVEAAAMAHTLALVFHEAATRHFRDHPPDNGRSIPPHPGILIDGPRPGTLRPHMPFALRFPLTTPLRPNSGPEALLCWTDGTANTVTFGERIEAFIVDDDDEQPDATE